MKNFAAGTQNRDSCRFSRSASRHNPQIRRSDQANKRSAPTSIDRSFRQQADTTRRSQKNALLRAGHNRRDLALVLRHKRKVALRSGHPGRFWQVPRLRHTVWPSHFSELTKHCLAFRANLRNQANMNRQHTERDVPPPHGATPGRESQSTVRAAPKLDFCHFVSCGQRDLPQALCRQRVARSMGRLPLGAATGCDATGYEKMANVELRACFKTGLTHGGTHSVASDFPAAGSPGTTERGPPLNSG